MRSSVKAYNNNNYFFNLFENSVTMLRFIEETEIRQKRKRITCLEIIDESSVSVFKQYENTHLKAFIQVLPLLYAAQYSFI